MRLALVVVCVGCVGSSASEQRGQESYALTCQDVALSCPGSDDAKKQMICHATADGRYVLLEVPVSSGHQPGQAHSDKPLPDLAPGAAGLDCACEPRVCLDVCSGVADGAQCDDGDPCTLLGTCRSGICEKGAPKCMPDVRVDTCREQTGACDATTGECLTREGAAPVVTSWSVDTPHSAGDDVPVSAGTGTLSLKLSASDGPDADTLPDNLPIGLASCSIDDGSSCACTDTSPSHDGTAWSCAFAGLTDANNPNVASIVVRDACGNDLQADRSWLVDSTADILAFDALIDPFSFVVDHGPAGVDQNIVDGSFMVAFSATDPVNDAFDSSILPLRRDCALDQGDPVPCPELFNVFIPVEGPHMLTLYFIDAVGNVSPSSTLTFYVDRSAPVFGDFAVANSLGTSELEGCVTADGLPVTDHDGTITFPASEPPNNVPDYVTYRCSLQRVASDPSVAVKSPLPNDVICEVRDGVIVDPACRCAPNTAFPYQGLSAGQYQLLVTATDGVGHASTASRDFAVRDPFSCTP